MKKYHWLSLIAILLTCILIVPVMAEVTPNKTAELIYNITTPLEDDVSFYDIVPAYFLVKGTISGSDAIRNITVIYGNESSECGKKHDGYYDVSCNFLFNPTIKQIIINVVDNQGLVTSERRNFTYYLGPPPPGTIYVYGTVIDIDGNPIHGAVLTFETEIKDYGHFSVNTTTDKNGKYSMKKANGFHQKITVQKAGYQIIVQEITFKPYNNDLNFTLSPQKLSVSGFDFVVAIFAIMIIFMLTFIRSEWK
jgi:hypothetical protein